MKDELGMQVTVACGQEENEWEEEEKASENYG